MKSMKTNYLISAALLCATMLSAKGGDKDLKTRPQLQRTVPSSVFLSSDEALNQISSSPTLSDFDKQGMKELNNLPVLKSLPLEEATEELLDSMVIKDENGENISRYLYEYDANGYRSLLLNQDWNDSTLVWENDYKYEYAYNNDGRQTLYAHYTYDSVWICDRKEENVWGVDTEGNTTELATYSEWDEESQSLMYTGKTEYVFYAKTYYYKQYIHYKYSEGTWQPSYKFVQDLKEYGVACEDDCDRIWIDYIWENNAWVGQSKEGHIYSEDESYDEYVIDYGWDSDAMDWTTKTVDEFDGSGSSEDDIISTAEYVLNGSEWQAVSKTGTDGDYTVYYDIVNNDFVKTYKDYVTYDANGLLNSYDRYDWNADRESWIQTKQISNLSWDNLSGEWRLNMYIGLEYDNEGRLLDKKQMYRGNSQSEWYEIYTWSNKYTYNEDGTTLTRSTYSWSGDEPTFYDDTFVYGDYTIQDSSYFYGERSYNVNITKDEADEYLVWINNLFNFNSTLYAMWSMDKTSLLIPVKQTCMIDGYSDNYFEVIGYSADDVNTELLEGDRISCTVAANGEIVVNNDFALYAYHISDSTAAAFLDYYKAGATLKPNNAKQPIFDLDHWDILNYQSNYYYYYSDHEVAGTEGAAYSVAVKAYPNPTQDQLIISGTTAGKSLRIADLNGQLQGTYTTTDGETKIDLSSYSAGAYIVTVGEYHVKIIRN